MKDKMCELILDFLSNLNITFLDTLNGGAKIFTTINLCLCLLEILLAIAQLALGSNRDQFLKFSSLLVYLLSEEDTFMQEIFHRNEKDSTPIFSKK